MAVAITIGTDNNRVSASKELDDDHYEVHPIIIESRISKAIKGTLRFDPVSKESFERRV